MKHSGLNLRLYENICVECLRKTTNYLMIFCDPMAFRSTPHLINSAHICGWLLHVRLCFLIQRMKLNRIRYFTPKLKEL